jgi:hypothetical protein
MRDETPPRRLVRTGERYACRWESFFFVMTVKQSLNLLHVGCHRDSCTVSSSMTMVILSPNRTENRHCSKPVPSSQATTVLIEKAIAHGEERE